ncbi:MAG: hypothetical protein AB7S41_20160 [Parvibaculaceae bacterium]
MIEETVRLLVPWLASAAAILLSASILARAARSRGRAQARARRKNPDLSDRLR